VGVRAALQEWKEVEEFDQRGWLVGQVVVLAVLWFSIVAKLDAPGDPAVDVSADVLWMELLGCWLFVRSLKWWVIGLRAAVLAIGSLAPRNRRIRLAGKYFVAAAVTVPIIPICARGISDLPPFAPVLIVLLLLVQFAVLSMPLDGLPPTLLFASGVALAPSRGGLCVMIAVLLFWLGTRSRGRAEEAQVRASRVRRQQGLADQRFEAEGTPERQQLVDRCHVLIHGTSSITLGIAGRRGVGKSNLLRLLLDRTGSAARPGKIAEADLRGPKKIPPPGSVGLFLRTPTSFDELGFITSLFERVALAVNRSVTGVLPAVQPYAVERELQQKRRLLWPLHLACLFMAAMVLAASVVPYARAVPKDPVVGALARRQAEPSGRERAAGSIPSVSPSLFGFSGLLLEIDSLAAREERLISGVAPEHGASWSRLTENHALLERRWGELRGQTAGILARFDTARAYGRRTLAIRDSLAALHLVSPVRWTPVDPPPSWTRMGLFYAGFIGLPLLLILAFRSTQEGVARMRRPAYDRVRYEVALYERTNEVLDRLRFQLSLAETVERSATVSAGSWLKPLRVSAMRRESRQVSRQSRPYTVFSAGEEFRAYCRDVVFYLGEAAAGRRPEGGGDDFRIVIAIDELDKAADLEQMREMLKTMKAVFDVPRVSYVLSISEDALEQFRLRNTDGKDEIDSTFTHVFHVPPLGAEASARFFLRGGLPPALLPAAVVFGAGVPRDMHRMAQRIRVDHAGAPEPAALLDHLYAQDREALRDMLHNDACIPGEARWRWTGMIPESWRAAPDGMARTVAELRAMSPELFAAASPCGPEAARRSFHRVVSLFVAHLAKARLYIEVARLPAPHPENDGAPLVDAEMRAWLAEVEALRGLFFHLEDDPHGTWERLAARPSRSVAVPVGILSGAHIA
jgi:hypothetical protein